MEEYELPEMQRSPLEELCLEVPEAADDRIIYIYMYSIITVKPLSLPAPTPTTCLNIKKHCVLWDKMHMSMIIPFILQRTA